MNSLLFAFLAPAFFLMTLGSMEAGRVLSAWLVITNEAREAARLGAVNHGRTDIDVAAAVQSSVTGRLASLLDPAGLTTAPSVVITGGVEPHIVVTIAYQVDLVVPLVSAVLPDPFPLVAQSSMRGE